MPNWELMEACFPVAGAVELPPLLGGFAPNDHAVVVVDQVAQRIGFVRAACGDGARSFRSIDGPLGMLLVIAVGAIQTVVEADNVERVGDAFLIVAIHGGRNHARGIEFVAALDHGCADLRALLGHRGLHLPLFVADGPEDDGGRIAIALHHRLQLRQAFGIRTHLPRLAHHHHAHAVAGFNPLRRGPDGCMCLESSAIFHSERNPCPRRKPPCARRS
jgi:hypothetical protein